MDTSRGQPLFLNAKTTVAPNSTGGVNSIALRNPMHRPMEILAISFEMEMTGFQGAGALPLPDEPPLNVLGGLIACKLDLGQWPITNGFVPTWSFGRSEQAFDEATQSSAVIIDPTSPTGVREATTQSYIWRLPRPLYVPNDSVLVPNFQHRGLFAKPVDVNVGYVCRSLPKGYEPKKIILPYAAAFVSKNFDVNTIAGSVSGFDTDESTETDLTNSFDEELCLQRFSGRALMYNNGAPSLSDETGQPLSAWASAGLTVRMVDSHGRPIIPNFTPFRTAFAGMTRSWEMDAGQMLDPRSYYNAILRVNSLGVPPADQFYTLQAMIGMVGWREMK